MKNYFLLLVIVATGLNANAQNWINDIQNHNANFFTVQKEFYEWKSTYPDSATASEEYEDITEQYYRWERFWRPRINPDGTLPPANRVVMERKKYAAAHNHIYRSPTDSSNWQPVIYTNAGDIDDVGRIDCIAISPIDSNTIWAGSPTGGLWKSTDNGLSWTTNTDTLASLGISDIVYNPQQPNIMYLATGNRDDANGGGSSFSVGVLKSTDGGQTWKTTGLDWSLSSSASVIKRLIIDPTNPNNLYAAVISDVYSYVYKTTDAGATWNTIFTTTSVNARLDIALRPRYPAVLYVAYLDQNGGTVQMNTSVDGGNTFLISTLLNVNPNVNNIRMATTPADSNYVYVLVANQQDFNSLYLSKDGGFSYTLQCDSPNILGYDCEAPGADGQGFYDISMAASPVNANEVTVGGINMWQSKDGGVTWLPKSCWKPSPAPFIHSDQHYTLYSPFHPNTIYQGCDGGIYKSADDGNSWACISANMKTTQFYGGDISQQNAGNVIGGAQDNGTIIITGGAATQIFGGDGGAYTFFNYANDNIFFLTVNGTPYSFVNNNLGNCGMTDFKVNPLNPNCYYTYSDGLYKSYDNAATFNLITPNVNPINNLTLDVKMAVADTNVLFAIINLQLYRLNGSDGNPVLISGNLPSIGIYTPWVFDYCVSDVDTNKIWLITSGLYDVPTNRVYYTSDGGNTWTDITGTLPDVPYNNIVLQNDADNAVYLATDMGVFYKNDLMSDWVNWSTGLPNTIISQLKIDYSTGQLLAVTFGRSIWETNLYSSPASGVEPINAKPVSAKIYPNPNNGSFTLQLKNAPPNAQLQIFNVLLEKCYSTQINSATTPVTLSHCAGGIYLYRILSSSGELIATGKFVVGK